MTSASIWRGPRVASAFRPDPITGDARVVVATSLDGVTWSAPRPVDNHRAPGHQFMPSIVFSAGQLQLLYYDQREDLSGLFGPFVDELPIIGGPSPRIRHTTEVRAAHATPGLDPTFTSVRVSDYLFGVPPGATGDALQYDPPNLPMFRLGTAPFMGDYIDIIPSQPIVHGRRDVDVQHGAVGVAALSRDLDRQPRRAAAARRRLDEVHAAQPSVRATDDQRLRSLTDAAGVHARFRRDPQSEHLHRARHGGLVAAALTNSKQLSSTLPRSFPIYVQNNTLVRRSYRLTHPHAADWRSRLVRSVLAAASLDVQVPPRSTVARSVHVTSSDPRASVPVDIVEITAPGGDGRHRRAVRRNRAQPGSERIPMSTIPTSTTRTSTIPMSTTRTSTMPRSTIPTSTTARCSVWRIPMSTTRTSTTPTSTTCSSSIPRS